MIYYCYGFLINNTESCPDLHIAWLSLGNVDKYILVSCHPLYDWTMEPQYLWAYFFMTLPMGPDLLLQIKIFSMILGPYHTRLLLSLFLWSWTMNNFSASKENTYQVHQSTFTILPVFLAMAVWWATHCSRGASSAQNCSTYIYCHQLIGFKACLHKTNWSSAHMGASCLASHLVSNSAWWATEAALEPLFQPVLSLPHQVRSLALCM